MINEVGTSVSEFNINDYIWYIVGAVALFFVVVGFIADKSGLAKKTFSKESNNSKKSRPNENSNVSNVTSVVPPVLEESIINENSANEFIVGSGENYEQSNLMMSESPVMEQPFDINGMNESVEVLEPIGENNSMINNVSGVEEQPVDVVEPVQDVDAIMDEISSVQEQPVNDTVDMLEQPMDVIESEENGSLAEGVLTSLENDADVIETTDSMDQEPIYLNNEQEVQNSYEEPVVQEENNSVWDIDSNEVTVNTEETPLGTDDLEQEWGVQTDITSNNATNLGDVELPNLEDINSDTEDDVWKF